MKPSISVIVTVYNFEGFLDRCLESIVSQSFRDLEVVVVDNQSTDGSAKIIRKFAAGDPRVRPFRTERHGKACESRQFGLRQAQGEYLTYVDADDYLKPGMYEHMYRVAKENDADIVASNFDMIYPDKYLPSYSRMSNETISVPERGYADYFYRYFCMERPNNFLWSRLFRRELVQMHDISFHLVDISEDTIFTMFATFFSGKVIHLDTPYYQYVQHEESTVRKVVREQNIAERFVQAYLTVVDKAREYGVADKFAVIFPLYAYTRLRSILFYTGLVGKDRNEACANARQAMAGTCFREHLVLALQGDYLQRYSDMHGFPPEKREEMRRMISVCLTD